MGAVTHPATENGPRSTVNSPYYIIQPQFRVVWTWYGSWVIDSLHLLNWFKLTYICFWNNINFHTLKGFFEGFLHWGHTKRQYTGPNYSTNHQCQIFDLACDGSDGSLNGSELVHNYI